MYSEEFIKYLMRHHGEPKKKPKNNVEKKAARNEKPHFGLIYAKLMREKYTPAVLNVR